MGIKSIIHCLDNFLFIGGCDSETCQHISASFQELAANLEVLLAGDLASVLPLMLLSWIILVGESRRAEEEASSLGHCYNPYLEHAKPSIFSSPLLCLETTNLSTLFKSKPVTA